MRYRLLILFFFLALKVTFAQSAIQTQLGSNVNYIVAKDGSGQYTTVQAAVNAVPNNSTTKKVIFVKIGTYNEKIEIPSTKTNLVLIGEDVNSTIITYNDYSGSGKIYNGIITSANGVAIGTSTSHTLYVASNDFSMMNITIKNSAGDVGQAVAFNSKGDRHFLYHCKLIGYQDTYYTWGTGRYYIKDSYIEGAVDYIFGNGVALFDSCQVHSVRSSSYITAAATDQNFKFGYVFNNCKLTAPSGISSVYLGRPWKAYGQTVFMNSEEGSFLSTAGWSEWSSAPANSNTCYYAEYKNCGAGSGTSSRVSWSHQLTASQASTYTMANLFDKTANPANYSANWLPAPESDAIYLVIKKNTSRFITTACFSPATCTATVTAGGATSFCQGGSVVLTASAGSGYLWKKDGTNVSTSQAYTATSAGAYTVTVTNSSGCSATSSATTVSITTTSTWYADTDGDAVGDANNTLSSCSKPSGYVTTSGDLCPNDANKTAPGGCGCGKVEGTCTDCAGVVNGTAVVDNCTRCVGGNTGKLACSLGIQAEAACETITGSLVEADVATKAGFQGTGYVNTPNATGAYAIFDVNASIASTATIGFRYGNTGAINRTAALTVNNGTTTTNYAFVINTASPDYWVVEEKAGVSLKVGQNLIKLTATNAEGLANLDFMYVVGTGYTVGNCTVVTSLSDTDDIGELSVYPNPFVHLMTVRSENAFDYQILDLSGSLLETGHGNKSSVEIGSKLKSGSYVLKISSSEGIKMLKINKK